MLRYLTTWTWAIAYDPSFTSAKKNKKVGRGALESLGRKPLTSAKG